MVLSSALFRLNINSKKCKFFFECLKISCTFALSLTNKTNIMKTKLQYAERWFKSQNIPTITIDNSIYLNTGTFPVELSEEEISFRAECYINNNQK